jgi:hypothetical protein
LLFLHEDPPPLGDIYFFGNTLDIYFCIGMRIIEWFDFEGKLNWTKLFLKFRIIELNCLFLKLNRTELLKWFGFMLLNQTITKFALKKSNFFHLKKPLIFQVVCWFKKLNFLLKKVRVDYLTSCFWRFFLFTMLSIRIEPKILWILLKSLITRLFLKFELHFLSIFFYLQNEFIAFHSI